VSSSSTVGSAWTLPADVSAAVQRWWDRGDLAKAHLDGLWDPRTVPVRHPTLTDLTIRYDAVATWADHWRTHGAAITGVVEQVQLGGRRTGTNKLPARVRYDTLYEATDQIGRTLDLNRLTALWERTKGGDIGLAEWVTAHPLRALEHAAEWAVVLDTCRWIADHATPRTYLRQINVLGADTKFVEERSALLADLLDCVLPSERIDTTHPPSQFAARYGFATKPSVVRFRPLSPLPGWPAQFTDVTIPARDFTALDLAVDDVYIVENETTYLAFPERPSAIVVWGVGYAAAVPADSWLTQRDTHYWGDLDTHGFSILDRIRTRLPNARSLLMDTETLLTYRVHWGHEANPSSLALPRLTNAERDTYQGLAENRWGDNVRLEQEHIPLDATLAS
jgi:hypothetical protein